MNLPLLPLAAIFLLLSGTGAPAHVAAQQQATAALLRALFASRDAGHCPAFAPCPPREPGRGYGGLGCQGDSTASWPLAVRSPRQLAAPGSLRTLAPGAFDRKQYRTRFGFADGAYQAVGPPAHDARTDLDWYPRG